MSYPGAVLADSPIGFWKMTEAGSPLANIGSDATTLTTLQASASYQFSTLLNSSGEKTPNLPTTAVFQASSAAYSPQAGASGLLTLEAIVRPTAATLAASAGMIFGRTTAGGGYEYDLRLDGSGHVQIDVYTAAGVTVASRVGLTTLVAGTKYHVVGTFDKAANSAHVYINGVLDDGAFSSSVNTSTNNGGPLWVGGRPDLSTVNTWQGELGWAALYGSVLSATRVQVHASEAFSATPSYNTRGPRHVSTIPRAQQRRGRIFSGPLSPGLLPTPTVNWALRGGPKWLPQGMARRGRSFYAHLVPGIAPPTPFINWTLRGGARGIPFGLPRRGKEFKPGLLIGSLIGAGFPQTVRTIQSRLGLGSAPARRGHQFIPPQGLGQATRILINSAGRSLAYVTMRVIPTGISLVSGAPFYPTTEVISPNQNGDWAAYVQPVTDFSDPTQFYLITEYYWDGRTKTYKARIPSSAGKTILLKDVLI